jgi:hypothetical protein
MAVKISTVVFWVVMPCGLVGGYSSRDETVRSMSVRRKWQGDERGSRYWSIYSPNNKHFPTAMCCSSVSQVIFFVNIVFAFVFFLPAIWWCERNALFRPDCCTNVSEELITRVSFSVCLNILQRSELHSEGLGRIHASVSTLFRCLFYEGVWFWFWVPRCWYKTGYLTSGLNLLHKMKGWQVQCSDKNDSKYVGRLDPWLRFLIIAFSLDNLSDTKFRLSHSCCTSVI